MPKFRIRKLKSTITISAVQPGQADARSAPAQPSLRFAQPAPASSGGDIETPSQTATEGKVGTGSNAPINAKSADPGKVAERVYDLMKEDLRIGRIRRGKN